MCMAVAIPTPVSYTHLDVYKRQDYIAECLDEFISHYGTLEEVVEHKDDIYYYPDCETMTDVAYYYIDAVSYTHLDVYKRQAQQTQRQSQNGR